MLSQGKVPTLQETQNERAEQLNLYIPGSLPRSVETLPSTFEEAELFRPLPATTVFTKEWIRPKRVVGIPGDKLARYRKGGETFRRLAKEQILKSLKIIPSPYQPEAAYTEEAMNIPTIPMYFLDGVPNYSEMPFGSGNSFGQAPPIERDWWGTLVSGLTTAGQSIIELERAKSEAKAAEARAKVLEAEFPLSTIFSKYLPHILVGAGIMILMKKRRRK